MEVVVIDKVFAVGDMVVVGTVLTVIAAVVVGTVLTVIAVVVVGCWRHTHYPHIGAASQHLRQESTALLRASRV